MFMFKGDILKKFRTVSSETPSRCNFPENSLHHKLLDNDK